MIWNLLLIFTHSMIFIFIIDWIFFEKMGIENDADGQKAD